jgi:hypothetical protein
MEGNMLEQTPRQCSAHPVLEQVRPTLQEVAEQAVHNQGPYPRL